MPRSTKKAARKTVRRSHDVDYEMDAVTMPEMLERLRRSLIARCGGAAMVVIGLWLALALATFSVSDPTFNNASGANVVNKAGPIGAYIVDLMLQTIGGASLLLPPLLLIWGGFAFIVGGSVIPVMTEEEDGSTPFIVWLRVAATPLMLILAAAFCGLLPEPVTWPFSAGVGGIAGDALVSLPRSFLSFLPPRLTGVLLGAVLFGVTVGMFGFTAGVTRARARAAARLAQRWAEAGLNASLPLFDRVSDSVTDSKGFAEQFAERLARDEPPVFGGDIQEQDLLKAHDDEVDDLDDVDTDHAESGDGTILRAERNIIRNTGKRKASKREVREMQPDLPVFSATDYELPALNLFAKPPVRREASVSDEALEENARMLETVLADFGVRGAIINVRPGPVVTLYELEPAAGVKSSRVIGLADDIARSMSAVAARVAVIPGRNAIGIELPNLNRETVYIREMIGAAEFEGSSGDLTLSLGKSIGGEPVFADLARMPHLLIAGTTGSGKSVGINAMILSLLYRLPPDQCKMIMIDPKMLELSVYEGIPHLLSPVVTDPRKAVVALKWTVKEMEERYRRMSKVGVRNIAGFNQRVIEAEESGEVLSRTVHSGYDEDSGEPIYETEELEYEPMPFIVVVIDEVADLMMVAGKEIEAMVQRLAQMARAAGIHLIMATQRPSVDVITGTIKANFPTRISFQVTSKIDSRTILGEQGAEQLLGQGDMLHMAGGGRIRRVHGAFVSDDEVEKVVKFLKKQGKPDYIQEVTEMRDDDDGAIAGLDIGGNTNSGDALYDKAIAVVLRDRKASTSYIQRRLQIGYNRAATLIERMEEEGVVSPANHAGKREILVGEDAA
ncbi:MAG: DNA translocase FtsK 4TM domain-containing protein [Pseudomonadota bacterium]